MTRLSKLYYVHDPMCSWCWAFNPVWKTILNALPVGIATRRLVGGLASDSDQPMPEELQTKLQATWQTIQRKVPGTEFNFDFWTECRPRRSTYPACRAVLAAKQQSQAHEEPMILSIQHAYYLNAKNPSDISTLIELAKDIGLDEKRFQMDLGSESLDKAFKEELRFVQTIGAVGFPSLILEEEGGFRSLHYSYTDPQVVLNQFDGFDRLR